MTKTNRQASTIHLSLEKKKKATSFLSLDKTSLPCVVANPPSPFQTHPTPTSPKTNIFAQPTHRILPPLTTDHPTPPSRP